MNRYWFSKKHNGIALACPSVWEMESSLVFFGVTFPLSLWATLKHFGNNRSSKAFHPVAKYEDQTSSEYATWFSSHWTSLCAALDFGVSIRSLTFRPEVFSFGPESQTAQPEIRSPPARDGEIEGSVPGHLEEQRLSLAKKDLRKAVLMPG